MASKKKKFDMLLFLPAFILILFGVVMVFSASSPTASLDPACNGDTYFFLKRHLAWLVLGFLGMWGAYKVDLLKWRKFSLVFIILSVFMLLLIFVPGLSRDVLGAKRAIFLGPVTIQPSEFAKLALIFYLADALARRQERGTRLSILSAAIPLMIFGTIMVLILKQPDLGTTITIAGSVMGLLFLAGTNGYHLMGIMAVGGIGAAVLIYKESYRMQRILAFVDPWKYPDSLGYQNIQSLIALGSGGLFGVGLGESRQKFFYLPERFTDFILAVIGEELGLFFGTIPITLLFILLLYKGLRIAANARDPFLSLLAGGIVFKIVIQAFINIGVVAGALPCTGIPLPFISFGGSSLIACLIGVGILLNVASEPRGQFGEVERRKLEKRPRFGDSVETHIVPDKSMRKMEG
jgi:cell division protein FtsW